MKRGFPRPKTFVTRTSRSPYLRNQKEQSGSYGRKWNNRTYPHPYSASDDVISNISSGRMKECVLFKRCGTCGDPVEEECVGLIIYNYRSPHINGKTPDRPLIHQESGPYHLKCLLLNFTMCPHLSATKLYEPAYGKWTDVRPQILETYGR